jgi:hypothetical protein
LLHLLRRLLLDRRRGLLYQRRRDRLHAVSRRRAHRLVGGRRLLLDHAARNHDSDEGQGRAAEGMHGGRL